MFRIFSTKKELKEKIRQRDKFITKLVKDNKALKTRVSDLEVECEFLFNNLSKKKRELVRPDKTN